MKLVIKLTAALVLAMCLVLVVYTYISIDRQMDAFVEETKRDHRTLGVVLDGAIATTRELYEGDQAPALVEHTNRARAGMTIRWLDASSRDASTRDLLDSVARSAQLSEHGGIVHVLAKTAGTHELRTYVPVGPQGDMIEIAESLAEGDVLVRARVFRLALTGLAMVLAGGVLAMLLGERFVASPVRRLMAKAAAVGRRDFSAPLVLRQRDELGALAHEMNMMADQLAEAQHALEAEATARLAAVEQLRHGERLMTVGKLAAGIAHELGTPLNIVSARAKMMAADDVTREEVVENAEIILAQSRRMTTIIRQMLDFARPRPPRRARTDLTELVRHTAEMLEPLAEPKGVALRFVDGPPVYTDVDRGQIEQALTNLALNAVEASRAGGVVTLGVEPPRSERRSNDDRAVENHPRILVTDHGSGIAAADLPHVFEPFFTTKEVGAGTGLGLSVAHGIVHEHAGWISIESEEGKGARFTIVLPTTDAPGPTEEAHK